VELGKLKHIFNKEKLKRFIKKILLINAEPWRIALSVAIGIFIGLFIPVGFQTIITIPLALFLQCNLFLATTATLISNPLTVVPLYYLNIKIGSFFTSIQISTDEFINLTSNFSFDSFQKLGADLLIVFFTGSFVEGLVAGILSYFIVLQSVKFYRKSKYHNC